MITLIQGNDADFDVTVTVEDIPMDISDFEIWFTIKANKSVPDTEANLQVTTNNGIDIINGPAGELTISLSALETQELPLGALLYCDVQIRTITNKVYTVLFDEIVVIERVTKDLDIV